MISPLFIIALTGVLLYFRKNKLIVFSLLFYIVNLLLVMQIVSIGNTLIAERYTYMPYVGLAFLFGMLLSKKGPMPAKAIAWLLPAVISVVFGYMTFQQTKVWKDSNSLWTNVIDLYPDSPVPRTNRAQNAIKLATTDTAYKSRINELFQQSLIDCTVAIKNKPDHAKAYENRQSIYIVQRKFDSALTDASMLIKLEPENWTGYYTRGMSYFNLNKPDSSLADINKCISLNPNSDITYNLRGTLLFNRFGKYDEAVADFTKAISINANSNYYINRSKCYYKKGDLEKAREDAKTAQQKGEVIAADYKQMINL
jgi:tetratricopeptide (TPR) repeat protein